LELRDLQIDVARPDPPERLKIVMDPHVLGREHIGRLHVLGHFRRDEGTARQPADIQFAPPLCRAYWLP